MSWASWARWHPRGSVTMAQSLRGMMVGSVWKALSACWQRGTPSTPSTQR